MKWRQSHPNWSKSWLVVSRSLTARSMQSLIRFRYCRAGQIYRQRIANNYWGKSRISSEGPTSNSKTACWVMYSTNHLQGRQLYSKFLVKCSKCQITKMKSSKVKCYHGTCKWSFTQSSAWSTFSHCQKCNHVQSPELRSKGDASWIMNLWGNPLLVPRCTHSYHYKLPGM